MSGDDWFDLPPEQRAEFYAMRMALLGELMADVRAHRAEQCDGYPLCPGADAAEKIRLIPPDQQGDFLASCLARIADQDGEIESLRTRLDQETARVRVLGRERAAAERDADAGWRAYRHEREAHQDRAT